MPFTVDGGVSGRNFSSMYPDPQVIGGGITSDGLPYYDYSSGATSFGVRPQSQLESMPLESLAVDGTGLRYGSSTGSDSSRASDQAYYNHLIANADNAGTAVLGMRPANTR